MKLNSQKLSVENFQDQKSWIARLFAPLNSFISQVYEGFNNQLTVADNLSMEIKSVTFVNEAGNFPVKFKTKFNKYPQMVLVGSCLDSNSGLPSVQPLIAWSFADQQLSLTSISGLTASSKYTIKILIIYE